MVSRSVPVFHLVSFVFLMMTLTSALSKPTKPLDAVDTCLFTCDYCYKGDILLQCANECLDQGGEMGRAWLKTCPFFGKPLYFD